MAERTALQVFSQSLAVFMGSSSILVFVRNKYSLVLPERGTNSENASSIIRMYVETVRDMIHLEDE